MAFLVCYSKSPPDHDARDKATYLDQSFYELIFQHCLSDEQHYPVLRALALLKYKSPVFVVPADSLKQLQIELLSLKECGTSNLQLEMFRQVCDNAIDNEWALTVSGDMYPELSA